VNLEDLGYRGEPFSHRVMPAGPADLERDNRDDLLAERRRVHLGPMSGVHAPIAHPAGLGLANGLELVPLKGLIPSEALPLPLQPVY
jgi:hypothetical protein